MSNQSNRAGVTVADRDDTTTTLEKEAKDFELWRVEDENKVIFKHLIPIPVGTIPDSELSDPFVWNIFNLRSSTDATFPPRKPGRVMFECAKKWIVIFRKYVLAVMKSYVMNEYLRIFNTEEFSVLRKSHYPVVQFKDMVTKMKDERSKEVVVVICVLMYV